MGRALLRKRIQVWLTAPVGAVSPEQPMNHFHVWSAWFASAAAALGLATSAQASETASTVPLDECGKAATLVIDAYAAKPARTRAALRAFSAESRLVPLLAAKPKRLLEGGIDGGHFVAAYKFKCQTHATKAMAGSAWQRLTVTLAPAQSQRITLFASDPDHLTPSPSSRSCNRPAYFVLKGQVSDPKRYFGYLRALTGSGLLQKHGMRREVIMPGTEVRLSWIGESFGPGEFFEILRFPCAAEIEQFWNSAEYRAIVPLRAGAMHADVWLYP